MSNPEHKPSESSRAKVIALVTNGTTQERIGEILELSPKTLRKWYARELHFGTANLLGDVLNNLARIATRGRSNAAVSACKYLLSTRGGYREGTALEIETGKGISGLLARVCGEDPKTIIAEKLRLMEARREQHEAPEGELARIADEDDADAEPAPSWQTHEPKF
jgi:hypothetical protein